MRSTEVEGRLDPLLMAVIANRLDAIVREMTSTLLRAGRSSVINVSRDFSCALCTGDSELLATAEGLPIHIFGSHLQAAEMTRRHPDLAPGDAFLDNDPYVGNTHHADHTILVPVFIEGEHLFTAVAKAHQADAGNSVPTTYHPFAKDIYEEGALSFPCVQVQRDYHDIDDIVSICRQRIRVPDQWYGDYLATVGAARTAERRLLQLGERYGTELLQEFVRQWFDYSERRMDAAIRAFPSGRYVGRGAHDAFGDFDAVPLQVVVDVDATEGRVEIDLRENPDCLPAGLNLSRATAVATTITGLLIALNADVPPNSGSFRRIRVLLRENCIVGIPLHPTSCSCATTNIAARLQNLTQSLLAEGGPEFGMAEVGPSLGVGLAVISGRDMRVGSTYFEKPYVNQLIVGNNGGGATPESDGWLTYQNPPNAALLYRDSVEILEQKYPLHVRSLRLVTDSGGPGRFRGAPTVEVVYGPVAAEMSLAWCGDGHDTPPRGIHGGHPGSLSGAVRIAVDGSSEPLPSMGHIQLQPGELVVAVENGGGGCGDPLEREISAVLADVIEGWVSAESARDIYGVVLTGDGAARSLEVDEEATRARRRELMAGLDAHQQRS